MGIRWDTEWKRDEPPLAEGGFSLKPALQDRIADLFLQYAERRDGLDGYVEKTIEMCRPVLREG